MVPRVSGKRPLMWVAAKPTENSTIEWPESTAYSCTVSRGGAGAAPARTARTARVARVMGPPHQRSPRPKPYMPICAGLPGSCLAKTVEILVNAPRRGGGAVDTHETTLLEHADRSDVVRRDERVERARANAAEELGERRGGDASPPVLAANPVRDQAPLVLRPARDVAHDALVQRDRLIAVGRVAKDLRPVREEFGPLLAG